MRSESARPSSADSSREVEVTCPRCGRSTSVPVSDDGAEIRVRPYVATFGEYGTARCPGDHLFWIYYCWEGAPLHRATAPREA